MKSIDVSEKVHSDFLMRFAFLREGVARAWFWAPAEVLKVNGREGCTAGRAGVIVTDSGAVIFYGGKTRTLGWEWIEAGQFSPEDVALQVDLDVHAPRLDLKLGSRDRNCHALLQLPLQGKPAHLGEYHLLRGFPKRLPAGQFQFLGIPFDLKTEHLQLQGGSKQEDRALIAEGPGSDGNRAVVLRRWSGINAPSNLELPLTAHCATVRTSLATVIYVFANAPGSAILLDTMSRSRLDEFLKAVQPALPGPSLPLLPEARPALYEVAGEFQGEIIPPTLVVVTPLTDKRLHLLVPSAGGKSWTLAAPVEITYTESHLVLFNKDQGLLLAIRAEPADATRLAEALGKNLAGYPWDAGFLALHLPAGKAANSVHVPLYFYKNDRRFESWSKSLPFEVDSKSLARIVVDGRPAYYLKWSDSESPLQLLVPEVDERRLREMVLVGQVEDEAAGNDLDHLYQVLNQLRVRNFLTRLFDELLVLHQQIHSNPSVVELLEDVAQLEQRAGKNAATNLPPLRRTEKQVREELLKKVILLASTLPELKRNLERLGTFYPYQVLTWDEQWLSRTFGPDVARAITSHARPAMIAELRGFVRTAQAGMWRSLAEIERILGRLEPVYSERMKEFRQKSLIRQLGASAVTGAIGVATGVATGFYLPAAMAGVTAVNSVIGAWDLGQQNNALLMDNAEDMLRWLQTFSDSLVMQIGESDDFLQRFFKRLSVRDRKLVLEHVDKAHQAAALLTIRSALKEQIRIETTSRFTELWQGAPQIRQDLVEAVDQLIHEGARLTSG